MTSDLLERLSAALADRYRIERELGQGGMATVYLAQDLKHDRKVALKVLKPELAAVLGAERFIVEIKTTASLQHPHILPLFDSGEARGFLYYVMPFIAGETLRAKLNRETQLGVDEAVKIATDVAGALDYAHRNGVIHRDIKPENILLHDGRPMVADFGIALALSAAAGGRMTETGLSLGTPHYMSPEQATAEKEISARSDVYSLASVLYEMLTGNPPHVGSSAQQIIMRIVTDTPRPVTDVRKSVPPHVEAAVMKALEKLPSDRFASAADFAHALGDSSRLTWQHPARAAASSPATRTRRWLVWAPTLVAVAAIAMAARSMLRAPVGSPRATLRVTLATVVGEFTPSLSIAADGQSVVYSAISNGVQRGYIRRLDALEPMAMKAVDGLFTTELLPDGASVVVADSRQQVRLVPLDGGSARPLVTSTIPAGMSWSNGRGLVMGMPAFSNTMWGLTLVPTTGTDTSRTVLTNPKPAAMHHAPLVLGDGETVLYEVVPTNQRSEARPHLGIGSLASKTWQTTELMIDAIVGFSDGVFVYRDGVAYKAIRLDLDQRKPIGEPLVIDGLPTGVVGAKMALNGTMVMATMSARFQLELVNERGEGEVIRKDTMSMVVPRYSPDGTRAAFLGENRADGPVWVLDLATRNVTRLAFEAADALDWTPDGRSVLASSASRGGVAKRAADGTAPTGNDASAPATRRGPNAPASLTVSPDGNTVVVGTSFDDGFDLKVLHLDDDTVRIPYLTTPATELTPRLSKDGRWLAYSSDESGRQEVYVKPFPGPGQRIQVSVDGGEQPVWSSDGRLFYRAGQSVMTSQLAFAGQTASVTSRRKLFEGDFFGTGFLTTTYDVSPDGRHFLMGRRIGGGGGQLIAWIDWLGPLKARLSAQP